MSSLVALIHFFNSGGEVWKKIRSTASKQVIPRRVGNFVEPLSDIADEFLAHLESIKDEFGNVDDIRPELSKWSFQGSKYQVIRGAGARP